MAILDYLWENKIKTDMRRRIRLTEGDLRRIVNRSVRRALNELNTDTYLRYAQGRDAQARGERELSPAMQRRVDNQNVSLRNLSNAGLRAANQQFAQDNGLRFNNSEKGSFSDTESSEGFGLDRDRDYRGTHVYGSLGLNGAEMNVDQGGGGLSGRDAHYKRNTFAAGNTNVARNPNSGYYLNHGNGWYSQGLDSSNGTQYPMSDQLAGKVNNAAQNMQRLYPYYPQK